MDLKERSPSFLGVKIAKTTSEKNSPSKTRKMMFKPMPSMQLLQSLKMYSPGDHASSTKKSNIKPARTDELNLDEFKKSPKITSRNIRKQLWSVEKGDSKWTVEKGDKLRRVTVMKPGRESLRKSVYSRPTMVQPKKNTTLKQSKCLSIDDTLPLMDMEQFTVTKIKRTLFSAPQSKQSNQRKTTSHINVNKLPIVSTFASKIAKPRTPTIVITPVEKSVKKSINNKTTSNNKPKVEHENHVDKMNLVFNKISNIEEKISSFDEIKVLLGAICTHLGIEVPVNFISKQQKTDEIEQISINKNCSKTNKEKSEIISPHFKREMSSTPLPTINEKVVNNTEFKETVYKLSPFIKKETSNITNVTNEENHIGLKFSPCTSKITTNQLENVETDKIRESNSMKFKLSPYISKLTTNQLENAETEKITESNSMKFKFSPYTSKPTTNQLETVETEKITESNSMNFKLLPYTSKLTTNQLENVETDKITESNTMKFKFLPYTSKLTTNQLENVEMDKTTESNSMNFKLTTCTSKITNQLKNIETDTITESNLMKFKFSPYTSKLTTNQSENIEADTTTESNSMKFIFSKLTTNHSENIETDTTTESNSIKSKLSPYTSEETNNYLENTETDTNTESNSFKSKLSPYTSEETNNYLENIERDTTIIELKSYKKNDKNINNNNNCRDEKIVDSVEISLNLKNISPRTPIHKKTLKPENIITPKTDYKIINKSESTIKLKKTWITQFEQLENKLLNNSNVSLNLNSSPDDSPVAPLQIDKIVNGDDDEINQLTLKKSHSTSNLFEENASSYRKNTLFKSKETDLLTESIYVYNELRGELPTFLSTPVNKTNKTMSFITPSVQGNEKKLLSRRVQEQLLRLNDF